MLPSRHVWTALAGEAEAPPPSVSETIRTYTSVGYGTMTHDAVRNARYASAIRQAPEQAWVEIGPGADAVLTKMVLDRDRDTTVLAVEGNPGAVAALRRQLRPYGGRAKVVASMSDEPAAVLALQREFKLGAGRRPALVQEIIGVLASSEGAARVVSGLREVVDLGTLVPSRAATFYAPAYAESWSASEAAPLYVAPGAFYLVRNLDVAGLRRATGGACRGRGAR